MTTQEPTSPPKTRPASARGTVSAGGIDELLDETPTYPVHRRGRLAGQAQGRRARRWLAGLSVLVPLLLWTGVKAWHAHLEAHRFDIPFAFSPADANARTLHWSMGNARLGLHVDGVSQIVVPGATIHLAPGHTHAQVWVEVASDSPVRVREIVGKVQVRHARPPKD